MTNTYDASYGRFGGGVVNTNIKSGGKNWHGDVFEFWRNRIMDANSFQNNFNGSPKGFTTSTSLVESWEVRFVRKGLHLRQLRRMAGSGFPFRLFPRRRPWRCATVSTSPNLATRSTIR